MAQLVVGIVDHPALDLMAEDDHQRGQREGNQRDWHKQQGPQPAAPKAPIMEREPVGAAKALHQRQHYAQAGKDAQAGGGEDHLPGVDMAAENVGLQQVQRVCGQQLLEGGAHRAHQRIALG